MNIKNLIVVTGMTGIQKIVANKNNGMLVEDLDTGRVRFAAVRKHQFSPLESISIFLDNDDTIEIGNVFQAMLEKQQELPLPALDSKPEQFREYFVAVLPNHDRDKVHIGDIRKVVRWFGFLNERGYMTMEEEKEEAAAESEEQQL